MSSAPRRPLNAPAPSDWPQLSEPPRYSLPELAVISAGARERLSLVSRLLIVGVGLLYLAWQPVMVWLTPHAFDPIWLRGVIAGCCLLAASLSLWRAWERHLLRFVHGLAGLITAHYVAIAAVNDLSHGYMMGLFVLLAAGGLLFFTLESMLAYGGFTVTLAVLAALFSHAPASTRVFLVLGVVSVQALLITSVYRRAIAQRALLGELEESERRFRSLAMGAPVGIFRCDLTAKCTFVNQEWCQLAGRSAEEALQGGWEPALHPDDRERWEQL